MEKNATFIITTLGFFIMKHKFLLSISYWRGVPESSFFLIYIDDDQSQIFSCWFLDSGPALEQSDQSGRFEPNVYGFLRFKSSFEIGWLIVEN